MPVVRDTDSDAPRGVRRKSASPSAGEVRVLAPQVVAPKAVVVTGPEGAAPKAAAPKAEAVTGPGSKPTGAPKAPTSHRRGNSIYAEPCSCERGRDH